MAFQKLETEHRGLEPLKNLPDMRRVFFSRIRVDHTVI